MADNSALIISKNIFPVYNNDKKFKDFREK